MPTIVTHAVVPLFLGAAAGSRAIPKRLLLVCGVAAMLPDLDTLSFHLGIPYGSPFGHRGAAHSLLVAFVVGLLSMPLAHWLRAGRWRTLVAVSLSVASHPLLDACTDGGRGVALLWPFTNHRYFAAFAPIEVSPIGMRFFSGRGLEVMLSEMIWVWLPAAIVALLIFRIRNECSLSSERDLSPGRPSDPEGRN